MNTSSQYASEECVSNDRHSSDDSFVDLTCFCLNFELFAFETIS